MLRVQVQLRTLHIAYFRIFKVEDLVVKTDSLQHNNYI